MSISVHLLAPGGKEMDTYGHLWKVKGRARGAEMARNSIEFHTFCTGHGDSLRSVKVHKVPIRCHIGQVVLRPGSLMIPKEFYGTLRNP